MDHSFASALVLLLLVLDPFGSLPIFISVLKGVAPERRTRVALRETLIAFAVLLAFMLAGQGFLNLMRLSERSLEVAGGVILLIIAIRMIFSGGAEVYASDSQREFLKLEEGDSYYFESTRPHRFRNPFDQPARLISAATPSNF